MAENELPDPVETQDTRPALPSIRPVIMKMALLTAGVMGVTVAGSYVGKALGEAHEAHKLAACQALQDGQPMKTDVFFEGQSDYIIGTCRRDFRVKIDECAYRDGIIATEKRAEGIGLKMSEKQVAEAKRFPPCPTGPSVGIILR